ncbi:MAG: hypothetical protein KGJ09_05530 [Candidatus Omnitrophica bacterium]|nr:hypothetical protein [Candidatus Omnitrophota bacterium]MDE2231646.1 hypothetical protein [Candidatus Omnitrophota bacterium]
MLRNYLYLTTVIFWLILCVPCPCGAQISSGASAQSPCDKAKGPQCRELQAADVEKEFIPLRADAEKEFAPLQADVQKEFTPVQADVQKKFAPLRADAEKEFCH